MLNPAAFLSSILKLSDYWQLTFYNILNSFEHKDLRICSDTWGQRLSCCLLSLSPSAGLCFSILNCRGAGLSLPGLAMGEAYETLCISILTSRASPTRVGRLVQQLSLELLSLWLCSHPRQNQSRGYFRDNSCLVEAP